MTLSASEIFEHLEQETTKSIDQQNVSFIETYIERLVAELFPDKKTVDQTFVTISNIAHKIGDIYRDLGPKSKNRNLLLQLLTLSSVVDGLAVFADLMVEDPPSDAPGALPSLAALFQTQPKQVDQLFPRLLDAIEHQQLAPMILDLANRYVRSDILSEHPAKDRLEPLGELFSSLVQRMHIIGSQPLESGIDAKQLPQTIEDSVALIVALINTFTLIGDNRIVGKLLQALDLQHRRVSTEVAAALAKFGETAGVERLIFMTEQPVVRRRALFHLEELGLLEKVKQKYQTPKAIAEAMLAMWLAEPLQFGFPPQEMQLVDQCEQFWPGYEEKQTCYLFEYTYQLPNSNVTGIGIAGPVVHGLAIDLSDQPPADIYAIYAGWQAEHTAITETAHESLTSTDREIFQSLQMAIENNGYTEIKPIKKGEFFGETHWVVQATKADRPGTIVIDEDAFHWFSSGQSSRPLGPLEAYLMHKGRVLIKQFNS